MKVKQKGTNAERELVHMFWGVGWAGVRVAGSGSMSYPSPDVLAGNGIRRLAIECKAIHERKKYFKRTEILELQEFSQKFGVEPWIGIRFDNDQWYFLNIEDLNKSPNGFSATFAIAKQKGLVFDELIGLFKQQRLI
ncbi:Holliday junction resolvase [Candidatus Woesearchaeota archaeon]|nr:Holliday junction resolvase [Candidatus Woesearchaeota archaeon]